MDQTQVQNPYKFNLVHVFFIFCAGAVIGPIGDFFHVLSGTTGYPQAKFGLYFWKLPFWVPLLFGSACLAIALIHTQLDLYLLRKHEALSSLNSKKIALGVVAHILHYSMSGYLPWPPGGLSDLIMASIALGIWFVFDRTWQAMFLALGTAAIGVCVELLLIRAGAFWYNPGHDNFYGVASWLPWIYVSAAISVGNMGRYLASRANFI